MSVVNFNNTTPAAPAASSNVRWQSDASGNISANATYGVWTNYTLVAAGGGAMTVPTTNTITARYWQIGPTLHFALVWQGSFGGTANAQVTFSLPGGTIATGPIAAASYVAAGVAPFSWSSIANVTGGNCVVTLVGGTFPLATTLNISVTGEFQVA